MFQLSFRDSEISMCVRVEWGDDAIRFGVHVPLRSVARSSAALLRLSWSSRRGPGACSARKRRETKERRNKVDSKGDFSAGGSLFHREAPSLSALPESANAHCPT